MDFSSARKRCNQQQSDETEQSIGQKDPAECSTNGKEQRLGEHLADDTQAVCADGRAEGHSRSRLTPRASSSPATLTQPMASRARTAYRSKWSELSVLPRMKVPMSRSLTRRPLVSG